MDLKPKGQKKGNIDGFIRPEFKQPVKPVQTLRPVLAKRSIPIQLATDPMKLTPKPIVERSEIKEPPASPVEAPKVPENQPDFPRYFSPYSQDTENQSPLNKKDHSEKKKRGWKNWSVKRRVIMSGLGILLIGMGIGGWYGAKIIGSVDKVFHGNVFSDVHALLSNVTLKGEAQGRVNILLAGDSADDPGHQGADLTDSIMVLSIDTKDHTGFMLSVPRDLWVNIPGIGNDKINDANTASSFSSPGLPSGGMGQLQQIVQTDLGIPIDYYSLIDYSAFKDAVDAVGGIQVNIQSPDPRGIYDSYTHLKLPNGLDTLDGDEALDLARARGDYVSGDVGYGLPNSDFSRTQHQRQMLVALASKAKTAGVFTNPVKVSNLFGAFSKDVHTNLNLQDALRLVQLTKGINLNSLDSLTYQYGGANSLISSYEAPDGESALAPTEGVDEFGQLQQYYKQLTSSNPVVREAPTAVILNGSSTDGLAAKESTTLKAEGFNVLSVSDADNEYPTSMVIDNTDGGKPASKQLLNTILPKTTIQSTTDSSPAEATEAQGYTANFIVILGQDAGSVQQP